MCDDLRPQLGLYGTQAVTPHIDALGKRAVMFSRAFAQFPWCSPSRQSFMTGRRPDTTKAWTFTTSFRDALPNAISLPEHFRRQGWHTVSVGKLFHGRNCVRGDPGCCPAAGSPAGAPGSPASGGANSSRCSRNNVWLANPPDGDWRGGNGSWSVHPVDFARVYCHGYEEEQGTEAAAAAGPSNEWCGVPTSAANESDWADFKVAATAIARLRAHAASHAAAADQRRSETTPTPTSPLFLGVGFRDDHLPWASPASWHRYETPSGQPLFACPSDCLVGVLTVTGLRGVACCAWRAMLPMVTAASTLRQYEPQPTARPQTSPPPRPWPGSTQPGPVQAPAKEPARTPTGCSRRCCRKRWRPTWRRLPSRTSSLGRSWPRTTRSATPTPP